MVTLNLPFPPSVNTYWRNFRGRMVLSKKGRDFKTSVIDYIIDNCKYKFGDDRLSITIVIQPRDKRKFDIDNRVKAILDSLEDSGLFNNDEQVDSLTVLRGRQIKDGGAVVVIERFNPPPVQR